MKSWMLPPYIEEYYISIFRTPAPILLDVLFLLKHEARHLNSFRQPMLSCPVALRRDFGNNKVA